MPKIRKLTIPGISPETMQRWRAKERISNHANHVAEAGDLAGALAEILFQVTCDEGILYQHKDSETVLCGVEYALRGMREKLNRETANEIEKDAGFLLRKNPITAPAKKAQAAKSE